MAKMKVHSDAAQDKKLFSSMMKKAPLKKVKTHLKEDIKEQAHGIKKDVKLAKSLKKKAY